jgi:hypothetical protein
MHSFIFESEMVIPYILGRREYYQKIGSGFYKLLEMLASIRLSPI